MGNIYKKKKYTSPPSLVCPLEVCHPRCVCENWKGYVVKDNYVN
jgi:hypothetical protein